MFQCLNNPPTHSDMRPRQRKRQGHIVINTWTIFVVVNPSLLFAFFFFFFFLIICLGWKKDHCMLLLNVTVQCHWSIKVLHVLAWMLNIPNYIYSRRFSSCQPRLCNGKGFFFFFSSLQALRQLQHIGWYVGRCLLSYKRSHFPHKHVKYGIANWKWTLLRYATAV